ncbi:MAG: hypothetical protein K9I70_07145 [Chitinophagaceae bacterium]|jgi:hypothetical protein|nr:hypothetical protein [Chitinophagaceae bacterium]
MRTFLLALLCLVLSVQTYAQFTFELKVESAMRVGNTDQFSVNGTVVTGRLEKGKIYFLEDGTKLVIENIISSKSASSVPVASANENVSLALTCKDFMPDHGDVLRAITTRPSMSVGGPRYNTNQLSEGVLSCRINGKIYRAKMVSKPVFIRASNILDMFFIAEDESVIWLQVNGFSEIATTPHNTKSDTSEKNPSLVCKVAFLPKGYRPTDMPTDYKAYEDMKGNSGIIITALNRYKKTVALEFSGILRANKKLLEDNGSSGLFYISEGRVDNVGWDAF